MANYVDSTVFINGSKRAIVDFLNKGLKGNKLSLRVYSRMAGEDIAAQLNTLDREHCLTASSFFPHPKTFDYWDTTNKMLSFIGWYENKFNGKSQEIYDFMLAHPDDFQPIEEQQEEEILPFDIFGDEPTGPLSPRFEPEDYDRALKMMHPELIASFSKYVRGYRRAQAYQQKKYGVVGWSDWVAKHHGCKWAAFEQWKCLKDDDGILCLTSEVESPWCAPITFFQYINSLKGLNVYAYGVYPPNECYMYNGKKNTTIEAVADEDSRFQQRLEAYAAERGVDLDSYDAQHGRVPGFHIEEVTSGIIQEYIEQYQNEICSDLDINYDDIRNGLVL